jgi:hypothetical protein
MRRSADPDGPVLRLWKEAPEEALAAPSTAAGGPVRAGSL